MIKTESFALQNYIYARAQFTHTHSYVRPLRCRWWWWWLSNVCSVKTKFNFFRMFVEAIKIYIRIWHIPPWNFGVDGCEWDRENTSISGRVSLHLIQLLFSPLFRTLIMNIPSFGFAFHRVAQWHSGFWVDFWKDFWKKHQILFNP